MWVHFSKGTYAINDRAAVLGKVSQRDTSNFHLVSSCFVVDKVPERIRWCFIRCETTK